MQQQSQSPSAGYMTVIVITVLVCVSLLVFSDGNPAVALLPVLGGLAAVALWRAPMRLIAHVLLFLALLIDNPTERPGRNLYRSPTYAIGMFLYEALSKAAKIPGAKATGLEILLLLLAAVVGLRMLVRDSVDGKQRFQAAPPLLKACVVSMGTLLTLEIYGLGRGGVFNYSLLQMRTMFFMPFMTMFFAYAFKSRRDIQGLMVTYLTVAYIRGLQCIYYYFTVIRHEAKAGGDAGDGSYTTTHSDSILAGVALTICIVAIYQHPTFRAFLLAALVVPVVGLGVLLNNRRTAFVAVALSLLFSYLMANSWFKRRMQRTALTLTPIGLLYIAAGWGAHGGWAKPVQSLKTVIMQKDTSSATRDIENYNLLQTLKQNPLIGSGFGHKYLEVVHAFDISKIFEAYRYVPHNSVLWFWGLGGVLGFSGFFMFLVVGVFMAARMARFAESNRQAVMAMTATAAVTCYLSQCYADMGLMSWMGSLVVSSSVGLVASLVVKNGGWAPNAVPEQDAETGVVG